MAGWFFLVAGTVALVLVGAAWRVLVTMRRASLGDTPLRLRVESGQQGEDVALRVVLSRARGRGRSTLHAIALEGDLARALAVRSPKGFVPECSRSTRYEDFEPDLEALAHRLDEEKPRTIEVSHLIQRLQREQYDVARKHRVERDTVEFSGRVLLDEQPVVVELPGQPIPEASGKVWIRASHRIGAATIDETVVVELPVESTSASVV